TYHLVTLSPCHLVTLSFPVCSGTMEGASRLRGGAAMTDERAFVRMIASEPGDGGARLVYADWLEEQGEADRAAFLRLEAQLALTPVTHPDYFRLHAAPHNLHARLDPPRLARIDRTDIENCFIQFEVPCPKRWERLRPTEADGVRVC